MFETVIQKLGLIYKAQESLYRAFNSFPRVSDSDTVRLGKATFATAYWIVESDICGHINDSWFQGREFYVCQAPHCVRRSSSICVKCLKELKTKKNIFGTYLRCPICEVGQLKKVGM